MSKQAAAKTPDDKVKTITPKPVPGKPSKKAAKSGTIGHNSKLAEGETANALLRDVADADKAGMLELTRDTVHEIEEFEEQKKSINKAVREKKQMLKRNGIRIGVINKVLAERKLEPETSKANRQEVDAILEYLEDQEEMDFSDNSEEKSEE